MIAETDEGLSEDEKKTRQALLESLPHEFLNALADPKRKVALAFSSTIFLPPQTANNEIVQHIPQLSRNSYLESAKQFAERFSNTLDRFRRASRETSSTSNLKAATAFSFLKERTRGHNGMTAPEIEKADAESEIATLLLEAKNKWGFQENYLSRLYELRDRAFRYDVANIDGSFDNITMEQIGVALAPVPFVLMAAAPVLAGGAAFGAVQVVRSLSLVSPSAGGLSEAAIAGIGASNYVASSILTPIAISSAQGGASEVIREINSDNSFHLGNFSNRFINSASEAGVKSIPIASAFGALPFATFAGAGLLSSTSNLLASKINGGLTLPASSKIVDLGTAGALGIYGGVESFKMVDAAISSYENYGQLAASGASSDEISEAGIEFYNQLTQVGTDLSLNLIPALRLFKRNQARVTESGTSLQGSNPDVADHLLNNYEKLKGLIDKSFELKTAGRTPSDPEQAQLFAEILRIREENFIIQRKISGLDVAISKLNPGDPMPREILDVMAVNLGGRVETLPLGYRFGYDTDSFYSRFLKEGYQPNKNKTDSVHGSQAHLNNDGSANLVSIAENPSDGAILLMTGIADPRKPPKLSGTIAILRDVKNTVKVPEATCFHQGVYCQSERLVPQVGIEDVGGLSHWTAKPVIRIIQGATGQPFPILEGFQIEYKKPVDVKALLKQDPSLTPSELKRIVESQPIITDPTQGLQPKRVALPKNKPVDEKKIYDLARLRSVDEKTKPMSKAESGKVVASILVGTNQPMMPIDFRPQIETSIADSIHLAWQESARASGRTERFKPAADKLPGGEPFKPEALSDYLKAKGIPPELQRFFKVHDGKLQEDILGLPNRYLHPSNRGENDSSASHAMDFILDQVSKGEPLDKNFIERASVGKDRDVIHRAIATFNNQVIVDSGIRTVNLTAIPSIND